MATEIAALGLIADSSGIVKATTDMREMARAALDTSKSVSMYTTAMQNVAQATNTVSASEERSSQTTRQRKTLLDSTLRIVNNTEGATARYARALDDLNKNLQKGNITQAEYAQMTTLVRQRMTEAEAATRTMQAQTGRNTFAITNASYQVQDFAVQVASGTDAMRAFAQQAPQFLGALGFTGRLAMLGSLAGTAVAIGSALFMALRQNDGKADSVAKTVDNLGNAYEAYASAVESAKSKTSEMTAEFGKNAAAGRHTYEMLAQIAQIEFHQKMDTAVEKLTGSMSRLDKYLSLNAQSLHLFNSGLESESASMYRTVIAGLAKDFGMTLGQAESLQQALTEVNNATGTLEESEAMRGLAQTLLDAANSGAKLPPTLMEAAREAANVAGHGYRMLELLDDQGQAARKVSDELLRQRDASYELITSQTMQVNMNRAIAQYGKDSKEVEHQKYLAAMDSAEAFIRQNELTGLHAEMVRQSAEALYDSELAVRESEAATAAWARTMSWVRAEINGIVSALSSMGGGMIQNAAKFAELAALREGKSLGDAARARRQVEMDAEFAQREAAATNIFSKLAVKGERALAEASLEIDGQLEEARKIARERERELNKSGKKGGGKAKLSDEQKEAVKLHREMTREAEKWAERILTNTERMKKEQAELNELYRQGYFGPTGSVEAMKTYSRALEMVREEYDPLISATREWAETLEKGIVDSIMGANSLSDAFYNVAKSIMEAALQASLFGKGPLADFFNVMPGGLFGSMNSTMSASNVVGNDYLSNALRGAMNLSYSGGGYTWSGPRSGGIDGEGGRLGILHPNETVIDHTRGGSGGGVSVNMPITIENKVSGVDVKATRSDKGIMLSVEQAVKDIVSSGRMDRAMVQRFGLRVSSSGVG